MAAALSADVAVVGGGIVGLAVLRMLSIVGMRAVLLEAKEELLTGASGGNSAILHEPVEEDGDVNPIELWCVQEGSRRARDLLEGLAPITAPFWKPCGALIVAWTLEEVAGLDELERRASANQVRFPLKHIDASEIYRLEPQLGPGALAALLVPGEAVIDSWLLAALYALQALALGRRSTSILRGFRVKSATPQPGDASGGVAGRQRGGWSLQAEDGRVVTARVVINAGGLYADEVEALRTPGLPSAFTIRPRRGQFLVFDCPAGSAAQPMLRHIIYPVPSQTTKGILLTPTVHGYVFCGPTAQEQQSRADRSVDAAVTNRLHDVAQRLCPALATATVATEYVGIRTATQFTDYQLVTHPFDNWITCAGVRSTGATGSLGVAEYIRRFCLPAFFSDSRLHQIYTSKELDQSAQDVAQSLLSALRAQQPDGLEVQFPDRSFRMKVVHPLSKLGLAKL